MAHVHDWRKIPDTQTERCRRGRCKMRRKFDCLHDPMVWRPRMVAHPNECGECGHAQPPTWVDEDEPQRFHRDYGPHSTKPDWYQCKACGAEWKSLTLMLQQAYSKESFMAAAEKASPFLEYLDR